MALVVAMNGGILAQQGGCGWYAVAVDCPSPGGSCMHDPDNDPCSFRNDFERAIGNFACGGPALPSTSCRDKVQGGEPVKAHCYDWYGCHMVGNECVRDNNAHRGTHEEKVKVTKNNDPLCLPAE